MSGGTRSIPGQETAGPEIGPGAAKAMSLTAVPLMNGVSIEPSSGQRSQSGDKSDLVATLLEIASIQVNSGDCKTHELAGRYAYALGTARGIAECALIRAGAR